MLRRPAAEPLMIEVCQSARRTRHAASEDAETFEAFASTTEALHFFEELAELLL
jgi:hypothetical protein